jgi:radical SAM superfamily enzyme YgiQ (UPF0313 family)
LSYRSRPAGGVIKTLRELRSRYGDLEFRFSDYILARNHYEELLPILAEEEPPFRLSCEIKANQSVSRMDLLARAGFVELQPGIESFSTELLKAMDKGVRGIHNVATLKLGYLNHVVIHYNVLFGFPGEKLDWYKDMLARIPDRTEGPATEPALGGPVGVAAGPGGIVYVSDELAHRVPQG